MLPGPVRGERPDLAAYLARAGYDADELASLAEAFLRVVPPPEPSEDDVAVMRARLDGEPGLLALRRRNGRKVDEVVDELAERLEIDDGHASGATTSGSRAVCSIPTPSTSASGMHPAGSSQRAFAA